MQARPEEQKSGEALISFLSARSVKATFEAVPDPPDLRFTVELPGAIHQTWAVEVTGIFENFEANGDARNRLFFEPDLRRLVKKLNNALTGQFRQEYFLYVEGPLDRALFRSLESRVLDYVGSGKTKEEALDWPEARAAARAKINSEKRDEPSVQPTIDITAMPLVKVKIKAHAGTRGIVLASAPPPLAPIPGTDTPYSDVRANLDYAFDKVLAAKLPRLKGLGDQYDRRALLILLGYPMWDFTDLYESVASKNVKLDDLDGIFVVDHEAHVHLVLNHDLVPL